MSLFLRTLLVASLLANVVLWLSRSPSRPAERHEARQGGPRPSFPFAAQSAPQPDYAAIERATLEQRLVAAEAKLADMMPIAKKFAAASRSMETETRVRPYLDEVFAQYQVDEPKYRLECRGRVCKVDSDVKDEWTRPLQQTFPGRAMFREMAFGPDGTFIELQPAEKLPAAFLNGMLRAAFVRARKPCSLAQAPAGDVDFTLEYDATTRRLTHEVTGTLADQPITACIAKQLDDVIAATTLLREMTSVRSWPDPLTLPVADEE